MPSERWRRPAGVLTVDDQHSEGIWLPDGRVHGNVRITVTAETLERMRAGYMCVKCLEPLEHSWPERCPVCGAPIRTEQAAFFAREYGGEQRLGPSSPLYDGGIHERAEKEKR